MLVSLDRISLLIAQDGKDELSSLQVFALFAAFAFLATLPVWTHRVPPLSDYANHLARMHVISTIVSNPQLSRF